MVVVVIIGVVVARSYYGNLPIARLIRELLRPGNFMHSMTAMPGQAITTRIFDLLDSIEQIYQYTQPITGNPLNWGFSKITGLQPS